MIFVEDKLSQVETYASNSQISAVDYCTFMNIPKGDYFCFSSTKALNQFYKKIGLFGKKFVENLYSLDHEYCKSLINSHIIKMRLKLYRVFDEFIFFLEETAAQNLDKVIDFVNSNPSWIESSYYSSNLNFVVNVGEKSYIYFHINLIKDRLTIYEIVDSDGLVFDYSTTESLSSPETSLTLDYFCRNKELSLIGYDNDDLKKVLSSGEISLILAATGGYAELLSETTLIEALRSISQVFTDGDTSIEKLVEFYDKVISRNLDN